MATTADIYTPKEIKRRTAEFNVATHHKHQRFALGATAIGVGLIALLLLTFYFMQGW